MNRRQTNIIKSSETGEYIIVDPDLAIQIPNRKRRLSVASEAVYKNNSSFYCPNKKTIEKAIIAKHRQQPSKLKLDDFEDMCRVNDIDHSYVIR